MKQRLEFEESKSLEELRKEALMQLAVIEAIHEVKILNKEEVVEVAVKASRSREELLRRMTALNTYVALQGRREVEIPLELLRGEK
ncbi:MAG: hypothetical protein J7L98_03670 [Candidatus Verstraetearchaeota archaeon]|nr:hypothetical protein [Candidatus Verstraetearchaeota archaeon]